MHVNRWVSTCYRSSIRICDYFVVVVLLFFCFFLGGGCWIIGINIQQLPIQTNVISVV